MSKYPDTIEEDIFAKAILNREGSSSRTALELDDCFVDDACAILKIARPASDEFCDHEECPEGFSPPKLNAITPSVAAKRVGESAH